MERDTQERAPQLQQADNAKRSTGMANGTAGLKDEEETLRS